jgi:prevent-host-death family protein
MITIPTVSTVADLQRNYRTLVNKLKAMGEPLLVVNAGKPEVVILDVESYKAQTERLQELEEESLLTAYKLGLKEYQEGKTVKLAKNQKLLSLIE